MNALNVVYKSGFTMLMGPESSLRLVDVVLVREKPEDNNRIFNI